MLWGKTFWGGAEPRGTHPLRLDLHFALSPFKAWISQHQKHSCSSPGCNSWKADVPQTQHPFNSHCQKNISLGVPFAYRLAESSRSLSPQDARTGIMSSRLSCLGMIRAIEFFEGRRFPQGIRRQQVQTDRELSQYFFQKIVHLPWFVTYV